MERDSQRRNALLRYAELMIEKINEVESSEWKNPGLRTASPAMLKTLMEERIIISIRFYYRWCVKTWLQNACIRHIQEGTRTWGKCKERRKRFPG